MDTMLQFVDAFADFGLIRKEPVLAIGGGLVTDVCGFACASYRRNTNFIRIPTTVIGLIDAAVSIKVGINHGKLKNRLGAYHAPIMTFLDFTFLKSLPIGQVRNGFAELIKISSVSDIRTWELLEKNGEALIETSFGRADGAKDDILNIAKEVCQRGIKVMLDVSSAYFDLRAQLLTLLSDGSLSRPTCTRSVLTVSLHSATPGRQLSS